MKYTAAAMILTIFILAACSSTPPEQRIRWDVVDADIASKGAVARQAEEDEYDHSRR